MESNWIRRVILGERTNLYTNNLTKKIITQSFSEGPVT
jgi:hypothetical protein